MELPYLTTRIPPIGGRIKERDEDFLVEELPLYQPSGRGEHIYLFVEKKGLSTMEVVHVLSRHFGVRAGDIGFAGMKDKHAITRQVVSIHAPRKTAADFPSLRNDKVSILWADQHANKLRLGHLAGNRFSIRVRGVQATDALRAHEALRVLEERGVPNFAGEQRFGSRQNNHRLGRALILRDWKACLDELLGPDPAYPHVNTEARAAYARGDFTAALDAFPRACRPERVALRALETGGTPEQAVRAIDITQRRFWFTALQSWVFNRCLARRIESGTFERCVAGDVAMKADNGALFKVAEADAALADRLTRFEISPTGPMWGKTMLRAEGEVDGIETAELAAAGVPPDALDEAVRHLGPAMSGTRRAFRIPLKYPDIEGGVDEHGPYIRLAFELPPGAFATTVLREIMKCDGAEGEGE